MQKITPCLWTDQPIQEMATFYTGLFGGKVSDAQETPDGQTLAMTIELFGQSFMLLGGAGSERPFTEAISLSVDCKDQAEVDKYWNALTADGGEESMCGWLKDKYGVSWQIVPEVLPRLMLHGADKAGAGRAMQAMLKMRKIIVADIEKAYAGA
jgi:predicted 3-demethylubiquinone-9 3-methyltransferase (glyoxalase superfamily)